MTVDVQAIAAQCTDVAPDTVKAFLGRLDGDYFARFVPDQIVQHIRGLSRLSADEPAQVLLTDKGDGRVGCAVMAFDHAFEFSLITGVLAGAGFAIESGDVFTLRPNVGGGEQPGAAPAPKRKFGVASAAGGGGGASQTLRLRSARRAAGRPARTDARAGHDPLRQAVIVDYFRGRPYTDEPFEQWAERLHDDLIEVIGLLDRGDEASVQQAKRRVNQMVTNRLSRLGLDSLPVMQPVEINIEQVTDQARPRTRLRIVGQDTPAFLYAVSNALSLNGLSIERVRIQGDGAHVEDDLDVVDAAGKPITDEAALERVRLSLLLTKQFTYFLDKAPDPYTALTRFEQLTEWIIDLPETSEQASKPARGELLEAISNPATMQDLAKLLGASDFLWEDFIRHQYESLLPIFKPLTERRRFCEPMETLPLRLEQALHGAVGLAEQQDRFNRFKDREIYLIDLDHILTPGSGFRELSERLVALAENLIAVATRVVYEDLARSYGEPKLDDGSPCGYAVFGLGKLGGVALGYASDVELLFMYSGPGKTAGGKRGKVANGEFFERLVQETRQSIRTKRAGIFEVDLRLRPYGMDGPLACSLEQFRAYYGPEGKAHVFERMALVRLRWLAGAAPLGFEVERLRDQFVYDGPKFDLDALWDIWDRVHREKNKPGVLNAKYSPGALTDLEGTVQLLQVTHASQAPQLRTPRLREALEGLGRAGVISAAHLADLYGAYKFLRRLINGLRMVRGNAQDLALPAAEADELNHLARRMGFHETDGRSPAEQLRAEFEQRTAAVRSFIEAHFSRPCPGA